VNVTPFRPSAARPRKRRHGAAGMNPMAGAIGDARGRHGAVGADAFGPSAADQAATRENGRTRGRGGPGQGVERPEGTPAAHRQRAAHARFLRPAGQGEAGAPGGIFEVFRKFHTIDPFGDYVFHGVPICRPEADRSSPDTRPGGLAARAEEWGRELEGAEERARELWDRMQDQEEIQPMEPAVDSHPRPCSSNRCARAGGRPRTAGASEPGVEPGEPAGQTEQAGAGEGTLHYRTGHSVPGKSPAFRALSRGRRRRSTPRSST